MIWSEAARLTVGDVRSPPGNASLNVVFSSDADVETVDFAFNPVREYELTAIHANSESSKSDEILILDTRMMGDGKSNDESSSRCVVSRNSTDFEGTEINTIKYSQNGKFLVTGGSARDVKVLGGQGQGQGQLGLGGDGSKVSESCESSHACKTKKYCY